MATNASGDDTFSTNESVSCAPAHRSSNDSKANRRLMRKLKKQHESSRLKNSSLLQTANRSIVCAKLQTVNRELANGYQFYKIRCDQLDRQVIDLAEQCRLLTTENSQLTDLVDTILYQRCMESEKQRRLLIAQVTSFRRLVPHRASRFEKLLTMPADATMAERAAATASGWLPAASLPSSRRNSQAAFEYECANQTVQNDADPDAGAAGAPRLSFFYRPAGRAPAPLATDPTLSTIEASASETTQAGDFGSTFSHKGAQKGLMLIAESTAVANREYAESVFASPLHEPVCAGVNSSKRHTTPTQQLDASSGEPAVAVQSPHENGSAHESPEMANGRRRSNRLEVARATTTEKEAARQVSALPSLQTTESHLITHPASCDETILSGFTLDGRAEPAKTHESSHRYQKEKRSKPRPTKESSSGKVAVETGSHTTGVCSNAKTDGKTERNEDVEPETKKRRKKADPADGKKKTVERKRRSSVAKLNCTVERDTKRDLNPDLFFDFVETTSEDDRAHSEIIARARQSIVMSSATSRRSSVCESVEEPAANAAASSKQRAYTSVCEKQAEVTPESMIDAIMANMDRRRMQKVRRFRTLNASAAQASASSNESEKLPLTDSTTLGLSIIDNNVQPGTNRLEQSAVLVGRQNRRRSKLNQVEPDCCDKVSKNVAIADKLVDQILGQAPAFTNENELPSNHENGLRRSKRSSVSNKSYAEFDCPTQRKPRRGENSFLASADQENRV